MSAALGLYRLQQVDSQIDQIQARQKWIQDTLQNDSNLRATAQAYAASESKFKEAERLLEQSEAEVEKQRNKIKQAEASLYGGSVRNPKELQDLQNDVASLKRHLATLESREIEAMMMFESAEKEFNSVKEELDKVQTVVTSQHSRLHAETDTLQKDIERLESERKAVVSDLSSTHLQAYDQLRERKRGTAVATILESSCGACGGALTAAQLQSARSAPQFFYCPTCGRILYAN